MCADQCPYDSIQMQDLSLLGSGMPGWRWIDGAEPPSERWFTPRFSDRQWNFGATPFRAMSGGLMATFPGHANDSPARRMRPAGSRRYYRFHLNVPPRTAEDGQTYQLNVTAGGGSAEVYLDGQSIPLSDPDAEKKAKQEEIRRKQAEKKAKQPDGAESRAKQAAPSKSEEELQTKFVATIAGQLLKAGTHLLAASVSAPPKLEDIVFDLSLQRLPPEQETVKEKLVDRRAVVCDQCSTLSGARHACVYACPHEAAIRIDGWTQLPEGEAAVR
jgi:ferredoxin